MSNRTPWTLVVLLLVGCGPTIRTTGDDAPANSDAAASELCGNGIDDDGDASIDEGCACSPGTEQPCFDVLEPSHAGHGACVAGRQTCVGDGEFGAWGGCSGGVGPIAEECNQQDDDCDGIVDDLPNCVIVDVVVDIDGDCVTATCPANAPYPIGCTISMAGNDQRGCVASTPTNSVVYFQEGDKCGVGKVTGKLECASLPGMPLSATTCAINKAQKFYPPTKAGCPST